VVVMKPKITVTSFHRSEEDIFDFLKNIGLEFVKKNPKAG